MSAERWQLVEEIFSEAVDLPAGAERASFLAARCGADTELRAEVERLSNEERQHVDDLREEVGDSLAQLASRFDVKARVAERKDEAVATVTQRVDRARTAVTGGAVTAKDAVTDTARRRPAAVAGGAGPRGGPPTRRPRRPPPPPERRSGAPARRGCARPPSPREG